MGSLLSRLVLGAGIAGTVMLGDPASAPAQPAGGAPAADAQKKDAAKKLVDQAIAAQGAGDYDKAIDLYRQAFALVPHPILMFNVGQAHRLAGRPAQAAQFYERYLTLDPSGKEAATARAHLEKIKASGVTPATGDTGDTGASATEPDPEGQAAQPPADGDAPPPDSQPGFELPPIADPVARPGRGLRITGLVLGGAGLVSLAVGGYVTTRVLALEDDATRPENAGRLDEIEADGEAAQRNQDIAYILGGGLIVGGVVTYYLGHRQGRATPTTALAPVVRPDYAGFVLSGSLP